MKPQILLDAAGKKFQGQWLFRQLNLEIHAGDSLAITGFNGSGKSTLLQIIAGYQSLSEGSIQYSAKGTSVDAEDWYKHIACATPLLELPEELSFCEVIQFFQSFKALRAGISAEKVADLAQLNTALHKPVKHFSSGMKQRAKISLALLSEAEVLLLDEPLANLDKPGVQWFQQLLKAERNDRTLIICSNHQSEETQLCERHFDLSEHVQSSN